MVPDKEWEHIGTRTTTGLKRTTKTRLDANRSSGQSYEGVVCQLLDAWEGLHREKTGGKTYFTNRLALPGETRVLAVWAANQLNYSQLSPPVTGALGVIGLSGRVSHRN